MIKELSKRKAFKELLLEGKQVQPSLHDRVFKRLFRDPKLLILLQKLVYFILEKTEQTFIKIKILKIEHGSSTGNGFKEVHSDALYSFELTHPREDKHIILVLDHKSRQSPKDIPQLRTYQERLSKDYGCMILPVFFYHGQALWKKSLSFQDQFRSLEDFPKSLLKFINFFHYRLIDLQKMDISKVKTPVLGLIFFAFQQVWSLKKGKDAQLKVLERFFDYAKQVKYEEVVNILLAYFLEYDDNLTWNIVQQIAEKTGYKEGGKTIIQWKVLWKEALHKVWRKAWIKASKRVGRKKNRMLF